MLPQISIFLVALQNTINKFYVSRVAKRVVLFVCGAIPMGRKKHDFVEHVTLIHSHEAELNCEANHVQMEKRTDIILHRY